MKVAYVVAAIGLTFGASGAADLLPHSGRYEPEEVLIVASRCYAPARTDVASIRGDGEVTLTRGGAARVDHMDRKGFDLLLDLALDASVREARAALPVSRGPDGRLYLVGIEDTSLDCDMNVEVRVGAWRRDLHCPHELVTALRSIAPIGEWWAETQELEQ